MGCFWSPEALFGQLPGVIRTCVGYAGGTSESPTYRDMGDHTETVQLAFDPHIISFEELVEIFWNSHNPLNINDYKGKQYRSLLFYSDEHQLEMIHQVSQRRIERGEVEPATDIMPISPFYLAEDRHQKYYLKRFPDAMRKLRHLFMTEKEIQNATLAARLNGLAKGYTNMARIVSELENWTIRRDDQQRLIELVKSMKW